MKMKKSPVIVSICVVIFASVKAIEIHESHVYPVQWHHSKDLTVDNVTTELESSNLLPQQMVELFAKAIPADKQKPLFGPFSIDDMMALNNFTNFSCKREDLNNHVEVCKELLALPETRPMQKFSPRKNLIYFCRRSLEEKVAHCSALSYMPADRLVKFIEPEGEFLKALRDTWERFALGWLKLFGGKRRGEEKIFMDLIDEGKLTEVENFINSYQ